MIARFSDLGVRIGKAWSMRRRDERAFAEIARSALVEAFDPEYDFERLVDDVLAVDALPPQNNAGETFGQPPVTVFRGEGFLIDVLFWIDGLVSVHQHGFSGAFLVLAGSSVHSRHTFTERTRINSAMLLGEVTFASAELLSRGDVREIIAGPGLIHATFHLECPTVTVVVRTDTEHETGPQYDYRRPSLALDPFAARPTSSKRLQMLRMLHRSRRSAYWRAVAALLSRTDWHAAYLVLEQGYGLLEGVEDRARLFGLAREALGAEIDVLLPVLDESAARRSLVARRDAETDAEMRFFLALLLTVPSRVAILDLVARRFPTEAAVDVVVRCLAKLGFDDGARTLSRALLAGVSDRDALKAWLAREGARFDNDYAMLKAVRTLRDVPGLRALLT